MNDYNESFRYYVARMKEIRLLSTPDLSKIESADDYSRILIQNFSRIGELAAENRKVIETFVKPAIQAGGRLTNEDVDRFELFSDLLVGDTSFEEVDTHLSELLSDMIMVSEIRDEESGDLNDRVIGMAKKVKRDYFVVSALTRYSNEGIVSFRARAIENRDSLARNIEKEAFLKLNGEARGAVLQFSLMGALLYENNLEAMPEEYWQKCLAVIEQAEEILRDPFYRECLPDYEWDKYEFRIYYYGSFLAYSILPAGVAKKVYDYAEKAIAFLQNCHNEEILAAVDEEQEKDLRYIASVQAGYTSARDACDAFYSAYEKRDRSDHTTTGINKNLDTPSSYLSISKNMGLELAEHDFDRYYEIEKSALDYIYHIPQNSDVYMKCVTLFINLPQYFREVPGAMTMKDFSISAFAALHPPIYVHINMVARLAECMTRHLLRTRPELFIGFPGCGTVADVTAAQDAIIRYSYQASLCHDIGKLYIIDIISMYGRNLLDDEFSMIKDHPVIGAKLAAEHASTRDYVDVIRGHHLWYDCSRGYPSGFDTFKSPYKTVIDIVLAADCLDAATDTVGRSSNREKTFSDYEKEVAEGAGTRYAPFLVDLFRQPELRNDIEYLLSEGRRTLYRETFRLLKSNEA